jgi:hypothetical protein
MQCTRDSIAPPGLAMRCNHHRASPMAGGTRNQLDPAVQDPRIRAEEYVDVLTNGSNRRL